MDSTAPRGAHEDKLKELAPKLVHEARNILNAMRAQLALLKKKGSRNPIDLERYTGNLDRLIVELDNLFHSFLTFARPPRSAPQPVDVRALAREVLEFVSLDLQQSKIQVEEQYDENVPLVLADRDRLRSVLLNLILNAKQSMCEGGRLGVRVYRDAENLVVEVRDTGCGIPEEVRQRIFEPFYSTKPGGTGLGLAIVKQTVDELGGQIEVSSREGAGTVFRIMLPIPVPTGAGPEQ